MGYKKIELQPKDRLPASLINAMQDAITEAAITFTKTIQSLQSSWTLSNGMYSQTISCSGLLATDTPIIDVVTNSSMDDNKLFIEAWSHIVRAVANDESITLYTDGTIPKVTFSVNVKVVR